MRTIDPVRVVSIYCFRLVLIVFVATSGIWAQSGPPQPPSQTLGPQAPCKFVELSFDPPTRRGNPAEMWCGPVNYHSSTIMGVLEFLPGLLDLGPYFDTVHSHHGTVPLALQSIPGMVRQDELNYHIGNPQVLLSSGGMTCDPPVPAEIEAFDGESFELNAQSPPGEATLRDFFGVDLASGQARVTLPTGQGFGIVGMHDTDLKVSIGSQIDRIGSLGRFASFHNDDYLLIDLLVPLDGSCTDHLSETFALEQLINAAPVIKRYRGGNATMWQNAGPLPVEPPISSPPFSGAFVSQNLNSCSVVLPDGTVIPTPQLLQISNKFTHQSIIDPAHPPLPPQSQYTQSVSEPDRAVFHAPPGVTQVLRWNCHGTVILDEQGTLYVYSPFYVARQKGVCVDGEDRPHGPPGAPPVPMVQVQVKARLMYEQTRDGLVTSYIYNAWGQLKGYVDPYGRAVGFVYHPLNSGPWGPNIVSAVVDQFGRTTSFQYDANWNLSKITLPSVSTGAAGQLPLAREIKVNIETTTLPIRPHQNFPVNPATQQVERTLMTGLRIGRPLDAVGNESVVVTFQVLPQAQSGISYVTSSIEGSALGPAWMGGASVGGTTSYEYSSTFFDRCPGSKWVRQTHPGSVVETYWFDEWGNETRRDLTSQNGTPVSWITASYGPFNLVTSTVDPAGLMRSFTYPFDTNPAGWWWQDILAQRNVLSETTHAVGSTNVLVHERIFGFFTLVKQERFPGTPSSTWDVLRAFDYEFPNPASLSGSILQEQARAVSTGIGTHGAPTTNSTFGPFGEILTTTDPIGRLTSFTYHPINDPDGDGTPNWGVGLWNGPGLPSGYRKATIVDAPGLALTTQSTLDERGREIKTTDPRGTLTQHLYNEMDQVFATASGDWVQLGNDFIPGLAPNGLTKTIRLFDVNGNVTSQKEYNDNPETTTHAPLIETRFYYDGLDRLVETAAMHVQPGSPAIQWVRTFWVRDALGRVIRQINTDGTTSSAEYTDQGQVSEKREHALKYSLDAQGAPIQGLQPLADHPDDKFHTLVYASDNLLVSATDGMGASATLHYDEYRRRVGRTDPVGSVLLRGLNSRGSVLWEEIRSSAASGQVLLKRTEYALDQLERLIETQAKWFDANGSPIDDGWVTTRYGLDLADQIVIVEDDAGSIIERDYDAAGRPTKLWYPADLNHPGTRDFDSFVYDESGNLIETSMTEFVPGGGSAVYQLHQAYDHLNRRTHTIQDPLSSNPAITSTVYDSLGNVLRTVRPSSAGLIGTMMFVDTQKRIVKTVDGYNATFTAPVDPSLAGDGYVTLTKTYDLFGHLLAERDDIDQTHVTSYEYDNLHRLVQVTYADGTYETTTYRRDGLPDHFRAFDEMGTLIFDIDQVYDAAKRKIYEYFHTYGAICGGVHTKHFVYDALGRVVDSYAASSNPLVPTSQFVTHSSYQHDSLGRVLSETQTFDRLDAGVFTRLHSHTITRAFDAFGNKTSVHSNLGTDPAGFEISKSYDKVQRLVAVEEERSAGVEIAAQFRWRGARGRLHDIGHWNGVTTHFDLYDSRGRLGELRVKDTSAATLAGRSYAYTSASTLSRELKLGTAPAASDYVFVHDVLDRLTRVRKGTWNGGTQDLTGTVNLSRREFDGAQSLSFLEVGIEGGAMISAAGVTDTTNALTSFGGIPITRDKRGNTIAIGAQYFLYDTMGHQICWTDDINTLNHVVIELYDAEDRRVYRFQDGVERYFVWDGQALLQELDLTAGVIDREYVEGPGIDRQVGQRIGGVPYTFHSDDKSTPFAATDQTGNVAEHYDVEPFGTLTATPGAGYTQSIGSRVGLHGGWQDPLNGRIYFRARIYDPILARFLSRDPIGVWGDVLNLGNPYGFVGNSPSAIRDPSGLIGIREIWNFAKSVGEKAWDSTKSFGRQLLREGFNERDAHAGFIDQGVKTLATAATFSSPVTAHLAWTGKWDPLGSLRSENVVGELMGANTSSASHTIGEISFEVTLSLLPVASPASRASGVTKTLEPLVNCASPKAQSCIGVADDLASLAAKNSGPHVLQNRAVGDAARDAIAASRPGSVIEKNFRVTGGLRRVDVLDGRTAIESKVGRTSLGRDERQQIARDVKLIRSGKVDSVEWHFAKSPTTGKSGPTSPLREKLNKFNIRIKE